MPTKKKTGPKPKIGTTLDISKVCSTIMDLMRDGASITEVAAELGIARSTFYEWRDEYSEIADTLKRAEDLSAAWWERCGRINLHTQGFSYTGWYMNMKNRFKWTDRQEVESTGKDGGPIKHEVESKVTLDIIDTRITDLLGANGYSYVTPVGDE